MITAVSNAATLASTQAARNWSANLRALATTQPGIVEQVQSLPVQGEWLFARDGSLTLQPSPGQWLGDCSVPYRAAIAMLKALEPRGTVQCFLAATHAAEVRAALGAVSPQQAVLALQPDPAWVRIMLACEDFTAAIAGHRLYFVTGDAWANDLRKLFEARPGLPTPQQFIKLPTIAADRADALIAGSQAVFAATNSQRTERIKALRDAPRPVSGTGTIAVIAGSRFALWDSPGEQLASALVPTDAINLRRLDPDSPLLTGPLATAEFCAKADALVTADIARCDFPDVLSRDLPWVTWITRGRIPNPATAGPRDALLVADGAWRDLAVRAGWPADRVDVAGFPPMAPAPAETTFDGWTVIADTLPVEMPRQLDQFSSHKLLWEAIEAQLRSDPFVLDEVAAYLHKRCRAMNVDESTLDRRMFIERLLTPAYIQGLVRAVCKAGIPLRLFGTGWGDIPEFRTLAAGAIRSRSELAAVLGGSRRLLHVWPGTGTHPIQASGLPVLRRRASLLDAFVREARAGRVPPAPQSSLPPISLSRALHVLGA